MVKSYAVLAAATAVVATFLSSPVQAASIEALPVTIMESKVPLTHFHPAYGAAVPDEVVEYRIARIETIAPVTNVSSTEPAATVAAPDLRRLEVTSDDIERLEDHFGAKMETNVDKLAQYASAAFTPAPWPSSYWPIYADGINYRWAGANVPSPSEKYASAFGLDTKTFTDAVSTSNGILSQNYRQACKQTSDCASTKDNSICGIRRGESSGYCIPGWFGICHAWAPAAILEKEPKCAVKKGSTTFQPFDIKALMTQVYDGAYVETVFTGARFNGPDYPEELDTFGRYTDAARRDLGPGYFHIAIHNIMGRFKKSFVVDVTAGAEVWNQPVRDYQVVETKGLTLKEGAQKYFKVNSWPFNSEAKKLLYVNTQFRWIVEAGEDGELVSTGRVNSYTTSANYKYVLELDSHNNIIGGEWVEESRKNHPDFLWFPTGRPDASVVTKIGLSYKHVLDLLDASVKCVDLNPTPAPTTVTPTPTPTTVAPTPVPTTVAPTPAPTTVTPTPTPTTVAPTPVPTTVAPTPAPTTVAPTPAPTTVTPTPTPTTVAPTPVPTTVAPTPAPTTVAPTPAPTTVTPTPVPTTVAPTPSPSTISPTPATSTVAPTPAPSTVSPTPAPSTVSPTSAPTTVAPTPTTVAPTPSPTKVVPTPKPSTAAPTPTPTPTPTKSTTPKPTPTKQCSTPRFGYCGRQGETPRCCPSGQECQALNKWFSQCTPVSSTCQKQQQGVSFGGEDLTHVYGLDASECCEHCAKTSGCKGYTFFNFVGKSQSVCYLKKSVLKTHKKDNAVSAVLDVPSQQQQQQQQQQGQKQQQQQQQKQYYH